MGVNSNKREDVKIFFIFLDISKMPKLIPLLLTITIVHAQLSNLMPIGTGKSQSILNSTEQVLFEYTSETFAVMNHFWAAGSPSVDDAIIRYYVDGETVPSIQFIPSRACGVGFDNQDAPWGTKWFGKGAKSTGWFHNFRIPFKTIRITYQLETEPSSKQVIWLIVRGLENYQFSIGDITLPFTARLKLIHTNVTLQPLELVDLVNIKKGSGMLFLTMMQVSSGNLNFMEGCFHFYNQKYVEWPGMLLSTGMEDYYDSAFYFNGGTFHSPVSGNTFLKPNVNGSAAQWSGYRFHEMDPIVFNEGMRFQWRNGDRSDSVSNLKCTTLTGGTINGNPQVSELLALMWVYQW